MFGTIRVKGEQMNIGTPGGGRVTHNTDHRHGLTVAMEAQCSNDPDCAVSETCPDDGSNENVSEN